MIVHQCEKAGRGFPPLRRRWLLWLLCVLFPVATDAHVGSPNVFFEGKAGPYPVHVVIRPPEVIPGLAEISVRVETPGIQKVTALPIKWNAGRKGAPPPDVARRVSGETNLYSAELWFMETGAQSIEIEVTGVSGRGRVTVPVDAVASRVMTMPKSLGGILAVLGVVLVAMLSSIIGAAVRESVLDPGEQPTERRHWRARGATVFAAILFALLLWGGKRWWDGNAADYRNNRLYRPMTASAEVRSEKGQRILRLEVTDQRFTYSPPLVPDHGKLMHLFLVREPKLDAFAHLHPIKRDRKTFETRLPVLPTGRYRLYADVTYETGLSDTLTTTVEVPELPPVFESKGASIPSDADDSWRIDSSLNTTATRECPLGGQTTMTWAAPQSLVPNQPVRLRFLVRDAGDHPVVLEPYLGMPGHLALRREDGSVFTHLHPGGSPSMAAMQLSSLRTEGKIKLDAAWGKEDPLCQLPALSAGEREWLRGPSTTEGSTVTFPYAFPRPGRYRLWVQVKVKGEILTGVYDVDVQKLEAKSRHLEARG